MCELDSDGKSIQEQTYEIYIEERKQLINAKREGTQSFDKAILTLAAGAFGLSFAFIEKVISNPRPGTVSILVCAWVFFCASLLSTLVSFLASQAACSKQIEILELEYFNESNRQLKKDKQRNKPAEWTNRLNILSIIAFIVGVISLTVFGTVNILF